MSLTAILVGFLGLLASANGFQAARLTHNLPSVESTLGRSPPSSHLPWAKQSTTTTTSRNMISLIPPDELPARGNRKTFQRYLEIECWKRAEMRDLERVLQAVAESCKQINRIVQRAQIDGLDGIATDEEGNALFENVQGEAQQQLDILCNTILMRAFCGSSRSIQAVVSEEEPTLRHCSEVMTDNAFAMGDYIGVFDPIDGSKNLDASLPVGLIFGIHKKEPGWKVDSETFLQDGGSLVAAGYCLFSSTTVLVLTVGSGVDGFTLDPDSGKFLHTLKDIRIPRKGDIYSVNEAYYRDFEPPVRQFLSTVKQGTSSTGMKATARYIGALVADVHSVLINGGIYAYPATRKHPNGKLRLLYECAPMAMIIEQAGGAGSTGKGRILDLQPNDIHDRCPIFVGSIENVFELDQFYQYYDTDEATSDEKADSHEQSSEAKEAAESKQ